MKAKKIDHLQVYNNLKSAGYKVELISGKWFINGQEYELYGLNGLCFTLMSVYPGYFGDYSNTEKWIKWFITMANQEDGEWPELPILTKAKEQMASGYRPDKLAYPLNEKELKIIHYLLAGDPKDTYAIFFYGVGGSGKSTICNLIEQLFGSKDTSRCSFNQLTEKFARESLAGKRLWYDADINASWSDKASNIFKKIITHDKDQFEKKGKDPYRAQYRCKPLFCCNVIPKFDLTDSGILRRILYYSKNEKIQNPDGNLANKKYTEQDLIDIAIAALLVDMTDWTKDFMEDTHRIILSTNNVGKYGMKGSYSDYEWRCNENRILPYGMEKWAKLREMFEQWTLDLEKI